MSDAQNKQQFRLVALDIDGTVLNSAQRVTPALKRTLAALRELSVRTVVCTGRRWRSTVEVLRQLEHVHPVVVCCGGALVKRAEDERTLHAMPMARSTARRATGLFREGGLVPFLLYDRPLSGRELALAESDRARAEGFPYLQANPGCFLWYRGDYPPGAEPPLVVYTVDALEAVRAAEPRVREGVAARGTVKAMLQPRYGADQIALEVHDPATTKWRALQWLLERWRISPDEVVAVGDDINDIPMLKAAGLSFAMGNGSPEVKAAADAVTATNDEDGAAAALYSVFLR